MQSVEIRYCIEDLHSCSVSSSAMIHEIAMAVEASFSGVSHSVIHGW